MSLRLRSALLPALLLGGCASTHIPPQAEPAAVAEALTAPAEASADAASAFIPVPIVEKETAAPTDESATVPSVDRGAASEALAALDEADIIGRGQASYYHKRFEGRRTASGQRYHDAELTAAHRTLPFGTKVRVTNTRNGRSIVVTINDRGPFRKGRIIDVSGAAARALGIMHHGLARVVLSRP